MTFVAGDIVKLKGDVYLTFITVKKGTECVVLEVEQSGIISLYVKGNYNRVCTVVPCEIEHVIAFD